MSRYKKVICGEIELEEINETKFLIYPTIESRMELLEHLKSTQIIEEVDERNEEGKTIGTKRIKGKYFNISNIANTCAKIVFEGCFNHDVNGERTSRKEGEEETTLKQILGLILDCDIMLVYFTILKSLDLIDKDKFEKMKQEAETKIKNQ